MKARIPCNPLSLKGMALTAAVMATLSLGEAGAKSADLDGDGIANLVDPDVDGDGIANGKDLNVDGGICRRGPFKGKYVGDHLSNDDPNEKDIDADGKKDDSSAELDIDGDGKKDDSDKETDIDGDGRADEAQSEVDIDGDGLDNTDLNEDDVDGDGISDHADDDCDGDGKDRDHDSDDDGDGISDDSDGDDDGNCVPDDLEIEHGDDGNGTTSGGVVTISGTLTISTGTSEVSSLTKIVSMRQVLEMISRSGQSIFFRDPLDAAKWLESLSEVDRRDFKPSVVNRWEDTPEDAEAVIARLRAEPNLSPVEIRLSIQELQETVVEDTPVMDETVPAS